MPKEAVRSGRGTSSRAPGKSIVDGTVEHRRVLADVDQRRQHRREIAGIGRQRRRGDGKAGPAQRRSDIGAEAAGSSIAPRAVFRRHEIQVEFDPRIVGVTREHRRSAALEQSRLSPPVVEDQFLLLDLRLVGEGGRRRCRQSCPDLVGREPGLDLIARAWSRPKADHEPHANRLPGLALARPERRSHAALGGQLARQCPRSRALDELQRAIGIGLANAVGPDEDAQAPQREADRPQRAIAGGGDLSDLEGQSLLLLVLVRPLFDQPPHHAHA